METAEPLASHFVAKFNSSNVPGPDGGGSLEVLTAYPFNARVSGDFVESPEVEISEAINGPA